VNAGITVPDAIVHFFLGPCSTFTRSFFQELLASGLVSFLAFSCSCCGQRVDALKSLGLSFKFTL